MRTGRLSLLGSVVASLALAASASADTVLVSTAVDEDGTGTDCSLREAIATQTGGTTFGGCTLVTGGTDQITFAPSLSGATIDLTEGQLGVDVADPLEIVGPGREELTISADTASRVLTNDAGSTLAISGLSVEDGSPAQALEAVRGGGILNLGDLTLTDVRVANNHATVTSTLDNAFADGGGIGISGDGSLALASSVVEGNTAGASVGGGVDSAQARGAGIFGDVGTTVVIVDSTIGDNTATATNTSLSPENASAVGGMFSAGDIDVAQSTFGGDSATATVGQPTGTATATAVGAIFAQGTGASNLELSTIAANLADAAAPGCEISTGIYTQANTLDVESSTIALNGPTTGGFLQGSNLVQDGGSVVLTNSIVSDPRGGGLNCFALDSGDLASGGFNVDFAPDGIQPSCFDPAQPTDLISDPLLAPAGLASNGGPTETIALQPGSPAIDAGSNTGITSDPNQDQRGLTRPVDFSGVPNAPGENGTDRGAFEVQLACAGQATPSTACPSGTPPAVGPTGQRAAAKKACKKKLKGKAKAKKRKKCLKRAKKLPI